MRLPLTPRAGIRLLIPFIVLGLLLLPDAFRPFDPVSYYSRTL